MRRGGALFAVVLAGMGLAGCASIHNEPVNAPLTRALTEADEGRPVPAYLDDMVVGLAFSGGGTRAAAFSFGVLKQVEQTTLPRGGGSLIDRIDFVSGVSGGSVTAAYFGLKKRAALADFREKFLLRDAEEGLRTDISVVNLSRAFAGGVNDASGLPRWLNDNLFHGATFAEFRAERRPRVWINAADIYNHTTFVFGETAFAAMCSDINSYPIADAVAASAAVPIVFAPVVIRTYPKQCPAPLPAWIDEARRNPNSPLLLRTFAAAMGRYHEGSMPYIKLLDGGLVDNFGLAGFTIARLSSKTPYGPLTPSQAVKLRRVMFLIVDAGRQSEGDWIRTVEGPNGPDLVKAAADTAIDASVRSSYTAFESTMNEWRDQLVRWRCGLPESRRRQLGAGPGWSCRDVKFFVGRIGFDQLEPQRAAQLGAVKTRFKLPAAEVDAVIEGGSEALKANDVYKAFLSSL